MSTSTADLYSVETLDATPVRPLKVVSIAHSAFGDGSSRLRYHPLAGKPDIDFTLVIPDKWQESRRPFKQGVDDGLLDIITSPILFRELPKINWYAHIYPRLSKLLKSLSPDVIHLWEEPWSLIALQACLLRDRIVPKAALILETEQNILHRLPPPFESIRRFTLKRTDMLVARQSEALAVSRQCGYRGPAALVEYVTDQRKFRLQDKQACKEELGLQGFTIGYVGRILRRKGLFTVLEALKLCPKPVTFVCVGVGEDIEDLKQVTRTLGLDNQVRFAPFQSADGVAKYMGAMDVHVLMSETLRTWKEQFGRVIIEAQSCGTPIIGSDSGAIPYVIGKGGWVVPEGKAERLSALVARLVDDPLEVHRVREEALQNVKRFSPEIVASNLRQAYTLASKHRLDARA